MALVIALIIFLVVCFCISYILGKPHPKFPPGPIRWPLWGGYLQLLMIDYKKPYMAMHRMARRYNTEVLGLYLGPYPTVVACSHASVRELLLRPEFQGRVHGFLARKRSPNNSVRGQFFTDGDLWVEQRRFMLRTLRDFGFGTRNKHFEGIIEEEIRDFIDLVQTDIKGVCHKGEVEVPSIFYSLFLNFSMELFLNARLPRALHFKLRDFAYAALRFQTAVEPTTGALSMTPWIRYLAPEHSRYNNFIGGNNGVKVYIQELVREHKDTFMTDALRDFCDVYLKEMSDKEEGDIKHWFSEEQLVMTLWDILFPSAMAVTATMGFSVQLLLHHPQYQDRVHQEIEQVVGKSRLPTLDDRKNLPFTEAVLKEVMRWQTLTPLALPHRCTEDTYFQGYFIPKDTVMLPNLYSAHVDETVWEQPFEFIPERHLEEDGQLKKKDLTTPFGLGKRVCAGETFARQNIFLVFSALMQHFSLKLPAGHPLPDMDNFITGLNNSPNPFRVVMVPR